MQMTLPVVVMVVQVLCAGAASAQTCLHQKGESPRDAERRTQALHAVGIVNAAQANQGSRYVELRHLADSPAVQAMRSEGGAVGEVARVMRFDREELLPGWRVHFVLGAQRYSIALTDVRDSCGFTFWSNESGDVMQGYPVTRPRLPLRSTSRW